jgi:flavorubredoxin
MLVRLCLIGLWAGVLVEIWDGIVVGEDTLTSKNVEDLLKHVVYVVDKIINKEPLMAIGKVGWAEVAKDKHKGINQDEVCYGFAV